MKIAAEIRARRPDLKLVLGGPHVTLVYSALKIERKRGVAKQTNIPRRLVFGGASVVTYRQAPSSRSSASSCSVGAFSISHGDFLYGPRVDMPAPALSVFRKRNSVLACPAAIFTRSIESSFFANATTSSSRANSMGQPPSQSRMSVK